MIRSRINNQQQQQFNHISFKSLSSIDSKIIIEHQSSFFQIGICRFILNSKSFNKDISNWDTSNLIDTCNMFDGAIKFNCDISQWNLKNVINYKYMFLGCHIDESKKPIIV